MPLYTPPTWRNYQRIVGSLRYSVPTHFTIYKKAGVWYKVQEPAIGECEGADYVFNRPTVVDSGVAAELIAYGEGTIT